MKNIFQNTMVGFIGVILVIIVVVFLTISLSLDSQRSSICSYEKNTGTVRIINIEDYNENYDLALITFGNKTRSFAIEDIPDGVDKVTVLTTKSCIYGFRYHYVLPLEKE